MRDHISGIIADRLADQLLANQPVAWGPLVMSADGITPTRGKYKNQLIPYDQISRTGAARGWFSLFRKGDKRGFISMQFASHNFWPCLALFQRMVIAAQPQPAGSEGA
jgi:hypothetical protein